MKIQALATLLVLGSSTAALAAPLHMGHGPVVREPVIRPAFRNDIHPIVREGYRPIVGVRPIIGGRFFHRPIVVMPAPVVVDMPAYAVAPSAFMAGAETIALDDATGAGLELDADGGCTFVQSALITYADGNTQSVHIGRELDGARPAIELQTDGSPVQSVTVFGSGNGVAAFMV
jgi:hypothetical protein